MPEILLRGAAASSEQSEQLTAASSIYGFFRMLDDNDEGHEHTSDNNEEQNAVSMITTVIVSIISFCCVVFVIRLMKRFFCRHYPETIEQANVLVQDGGILFGLNGLQKRAVLETIFSDTSKTYSEDGLTKKKDKKTIEQGKPETKDAKKENVRTISFIPQTPTRKKLKVAADEAPVLKASKASSSTPAASLASADQEPTAPSSTPIGASATGASEGVEITSLTSPPDDPLCLPSLSKEKCKEEEGACKKEPAELHSVAAVASMDAVAENRSNDGDSDDEDNICAICLSSYQEGEVLVTSKYCSHLFHKECVFEWLENHHICPCCRAEMVTEGEIDQAAKKLVGKQRMCKAIQTRTAAPQQSQPDAPSASARPPRVRRVGQSFR